MSKYDITINVTSHSEGLLLHKTLRSVIAGYDFAKNKGINMQINLSLDRATQESVRVAKEFTAKYSYIKLHQIELGDLAENRNYLISVSEGKYIAFFDGDDFFSENYLYEAFKLAEKNPTPAVYSPIYLISFDQQNYITKKLDFNDDTFKVINMYEHNYFISQVFAHKDVYKDNLYRPNRNGYGMEDWDWNNRSICKGIKFYNVPGTIFLYRRKKNGLLSSQVADKAVLRPSPLFEPKNFTSFSSYTYNSEAKISNSKINKHIKRIARISTLGTDVGYDYLRNQYVLNKNLVKRTGYLLKKKLTVQLPDNTDQQSIFSNTNVAKHLKDIGVDKQIIELWKKINSFEPMIRPASDVLSNFGLVEYPIQSIPSLTYYKLCQELKDIEFEDMVLVPHIIRGGADLAIVKLVKSLSKDTYKNILVFTTLNVESPWADQIKELKNVKFIELKDYCKDLTYDDKLIFVLRIIQNWGIKRLNIINSELGYDLLRLYGKAVSAQTNTYLHTYAFDMDSEGHIWNYIKNGLVDVYENVNLFITDSENYKNQLIEVNGFDESKVTTLYMPVNKMSSYQRPPKPTKKVLWASRLSSAKLVEEAIKVGKVLAEHNIELHFYGALDAEYEKDNHFVELIKDSSSIYYHGKYDGFESINTQHYDILLLTSKNEGMPNVVLEAISSDIFVVAPRVGGIPEIIEDGVNGFLVDDNLHYHEYVQKILDYYKSPASNEKVNEFNSKILKRHSKENYESKLKKILI